MDTYKTWDWLYITSWTASLIRITTSLSNSGTNELNRSQESNFELNYVGQKRYGVVDGSGTTITYLGFNNKVDTLKWLSPEDVERLREARDSLEAPR